jgi:hypothetical protein
MRTRPIEAAINRIVDSCSGDVRGALKALLLVNEQLEHIPLTFTRTPHA